MLNKKIFLIISAFLVLVLMSSGCTSPVNDDSQYPDLELSTPTTEIFEDGSALVDVSITNNGAVEYRNIDVVFDIYNQNNEKIATVNGNKIISLDPGEDAYISHGWNSNPPDGMVAAEARVVNATKK